MSTDFGTLTCATCAKTFIWTREQVLAAVRRTPLDDMNEDKPTFLEPPKNCPTCREKGLA